MENKYLKMIEIDENIIEFGKLYEESHLLGVELANKYSKIVSVFQSLFKNLIKNRRVLFYKEERKNHWGGTNSYTIGLGVSGMGIINYGTNLFYDDYIIMEYKNIIINHYELIYPKIMTTKKSQFDIIIDALKKFKPEVDRVIELKIQKEVDSSSINKCGYFYGNPCKLKLVYVRCELLHSGFGIYGSESDNTETRNGKWLSPKNLDDMISYNHLLPDMIQLLKEFIDLQKVELKYLKNYLETPEFKKVLELYNDKQMVEAL